MARVMFASVRFVGTDAAIVLAVGKTREELSGDVLPVWFGPPGYHRTPRVGDRLPTWVDVSTRYLLAAQPQIAAQSGGGAGT